MLDFSPAFFRSLQQLKIRTRRAVLGSRQGSHRSVHRGNGLEFADYRQYSPGDDFRHIDWGVLGRTDRMYVREYREEQSLSVLITVDGSASMIRPENKYDFACRLALSLGYVALADGDALQLTLLGRARAPRMRGARAFTRAREFFVKNQPSGTFDFLDQIRSQLAQTKVPGRYFLISDFLMPLDTLFPALDAIRGRNFELTLLQVLSADELRLPEGEDEILLEDIETGQVQRMVFDREIRQEYGKRLAEHTNQIELYCQRSGIVHALLSADEDLTQVVLQRFPELKLLE